MSTLNMALLSIILTAAQMMMRGFCLNKHGSTRTLALGARRVDTPHELPEGKLSAHFLAGIGFGDGVPYERQSQAIYHVLQGTPRRYMDQELF